jgi:hypothetical protein
MRLNPARPRAAPAGNAVTALAKAAAQAARSSVVAAWLTAMGRTRERVAAPPAEPAAGPDTPAAERSRP